MLNLLKSDGPGGDVIYANEQTLSIVKLELNELDLISFFFSNTLQKVLEQSEDAGVELSVMEGIDFSDDSPAIDENVLFKRHSFEYIKIDLVDILQVLSKFKELLMDYALSNFLMLEDKCLF